MRILLSLRPSAPETAIAPLQSNTRTAWLALQAALFFATLAWLSVPAAHAQFRASIQGVVTDPTGAVIPGATLTLTDEGTNESQVRTSDAAGIYNFNALPPDVFTLVVEKEGFEKKVLSDLQLIPEQPNAINVVLAVGASTATVTVNASTQSALDTETANNGISIDANVVQHFPEFERDAMQLVQLAPGTLADGSQQGSGGGFAAPGTQSNASKGGGGGNLGSNSSIFATENGPSANTNGGQYQNNGFTVDGISTVSVVWGGSTIITPSMESIGNIQIVTNAYDAENGRFDGAMTEVTTKSGTNDFHGSIFGYIARPGLNAYQRWNGPASVTNKKLLLRDTDRYNQWGGSIGGPIWKNKIFAFFAYEGQKLNGVPQTSTGWYVTSALAGLAPTNSIASTYLNFPKAAVIGTAATGVTCADAGLIQEPATGANCNAVSGGLNIGSPLTTALGTQDLTWVSSSNPGVGNGLSTTADIDEYTISNPTSSDFKQYNGRLDADATSKDHLAFAIYWIPASTTKYNGGYGYDLFNHSQTNNATSLIWNHIFSPTFLNEARANAAGWRYNEVTDNPQEPVGLPQDFVMNIGSIGIGQFGPGYPAQYDQWTYSYKDVATKVLHAHTMKAGFELTRLYYESVPINIPQYTFYNLWDFMNDAPEAEGGGFQATTGLPGGFRNDNREDVLGIFFQDDWKVRPNLTVSAGLRWSYFGPMDDKDNHMGVLTFGSGTSLLTGITIRTGIDAWGAQKGNFGPEVGFNWAPGYFKSKLVVRGGFGLNYNGEQIANANNYDGNPPGTNYISSSSTSPTNINPNILYAVSTNVHSVSGYPANPSAITTFIPAGMPNAGLPTAGHANLDGLPGNMPTQYLEHYSLDVEQDFGHAIVLNLGYVGGLGRHEMYNYDATALGDIIGAPQSFYVNSVNTFGSGGWSMNNMLLAGLKHQFSHTFSADAQFTWGRSADTNSGPYSRSPYLYNPKFSYSRSDFDVNRSFKLFGVWQPVIFHGSNAWMEKAAGGWSLSGIWTIHTGFGWTPTYTAPHQFYCQTCNYGYLALRPNYLGGAGRNTSNGAFETGSNFVPPGTPANPENTGTNNNLFTDNYFSVPDFTAAITDNTGQSTNNYIPAPGIGRNSFPGPGYRDIDLTIGKAFGLPKMPVLGEDAKFEIKANMFNIFNLLNINPSSLSTSVQSSNLGQAGSALGARTVDFQARFSF